VLGACEFVLLALINISAHSAVRTSEALFAFAREATLCVNTQGILVTIILLFTALVEITTKFAVTSETLLTLAGVASSSIGAHRI